MLQFAVVKMRLFARVLCLERHEDLAADATAAYERLVAKVSSSYVSQLTFALRDVEPKAKSMS